MTAMGPRHILHAHFLMPAGHDGALYPQLLSLLHGITPVVQALPPDRADLDITGALKHFGRDARGIGDVLRIRTLALYGVQTTLGAGPNRLLAAMAAAAAPPGGITVVGHQAHDISAFLRPRPAAALYGVGPKTAKTLTRHGLHTIADLADAPLLTVQRILGAANGRALHERAHGRDDRPVIPQAAPRSTSCEHTFTRDELDPAQHRRTILGLSSQLGARLRATGQIADILALTVRYADRSTTTRSRALPESTGHTIALTRIAYDLYEALGLERARVRGISLRAEGLRPAREAARQLTFDPGTDKALLLEAVADRARERFGAGAIKPAALAPPPRQ